MIDTTDNIISLTDFKRNTADVLKRVKDDKEPAVLTVNGSASVVVLDAKEYQKMAKDAQLGSIMRGIEAGLDSMAANKGIPLETAFDMLKNDIRKQARQQG